jgi:AbrB family looped-hinge helix DNA binding protein
MRSDCVQIDKAGRIVLPKRVRDRLNLVPGDKLRLMLDDRTVRLEPVELTGRLTRKGSVLIFTGDFEEPITNDLIDSMLRADRESFLRVLAQEEGPE